MSQDEIIRQLKELQFVNSSITGSVLAANVLEILAIKDARIVELEKLLLESRNDYS